MENDIPIINHLFLLGIIKTVNNISVFMHKNALVKIADRLEIPDPVEFVSSRPFKYASSVDDESVKTFVKLLNNDV